MKSPIQLFRTDMRSRSSFWIGSFDTHDQACMHMRVSGLKDTELVAVSPDALPVISQSEFDRQVRLIEQELTSARVTLQDPRDLAAKLQIKAQIRDLEQKRTQFRLHVYSFVPAMRICVASQLITQINVLENLV